MAAASVLCPVDFSEPARAALVYAGAIADHFAARLTALAVDDPLLADAAAVAGLSPSLAEQTEVELHRVCRGVLGDPITGPKRLEYRVRIGKPSTEILSQAQESAADLIVMSSRGQTGVRKLFFGSTTERVLRETSLPVLVTPPELPARRSFDDIAKHVSRVVVPVDLTPASARQASIAAAIAKGLSVPLLVAHVLEPFVVPSRVRLALPGGERARRAAAEDALKEMLGSLSVAASTETFVLSGDPAEEIVKLTDTRHANLIVMGLHSSEGFGPRMGTVTYRVLALTRTLVLALPPLPSQSSHR
jgi:nucleotide-binding universal stress UspA family protein